MKIKYKIIIGLFVFVASICLFIFWAGGFAFLHRNFPWISVPGYFRYPFIHEMEVHVGDESVFVSDRTEAIQIFNMMGGHYTGFRVRTFPSVPTSAGGTVERWLTTEEALSTGFDYRFEIVLRGRRGRTLTLIPINVHTADYKGRDVLLFAVETNQIISINRFNEFFFWAYYNELPVDVSQVYVPAHWSRPSE